MRKHALGGHEHPPGNFVVPRLVKRGVESEERPPRPAEARPMGGSLPTLQKQETNVEPA